MDTPRVRARIGVTLVGLLGFCSLTDAKVVYVAKTGSDASDGLSWATAKVTVQAGLNAALPGDEVWVAVGTYVERITLAAGVGLYGGFAGREVDRLHRDWKVNTTILDGSGGGSVVTSPSGATSVTRIDGFRIRNGRNVDYGGGGIRCTSSSPTIANNAIIGNIGSYGGGISCTGGSPAILNNAIVGNGAYGGGGIYCSSSSAVISNNTVLGNAASSIGGGVCSYISAPTITNTIVAFNTSGLAVSGAGTLSLRCNCVYGNTGYDYSGIADPTGNDGNVRADPRLLAADYGEVHLKPDSPCIDAGDDVVAQHGAVDMDGEKRIHGEHVDIGADEFNGRLPSFIPSVVRVAPSGNDSLDGSSWAQSKRTVQAGIDALAIAGGGDVWVAAGTYTERITLKPFVHVYGGFAAIEASREQRDRIVHVTILDGQQGGSVVTAIQPGYKLSTIDGFTIRNGRSFLSGGGVYCSFSSPIIANNTIMGNTAQSGGGIHCSYSRPVILNDTITGNSASSGGGIDCHYGSPTVVNCAITGNRASSGGGINCYFSSPVSTNCTITGNSASRGGGVDCRFSTPTVTNNTITHNSASSGGGICCESSSPTITNTIVAFNSSGIARPPSSTIPALRCNCVYGNTAYDYSGLADPTGTNGNISVDPRLLAADYGDVHLKAGSPCVDAGDDNAVPPGQADLDGEPRTHGTHVDIGVDEFNGAQPFFTPRVVRVAVSGDDSNDGSSWEQPKRTVQAGIDAIAGVGGGDVWVAAGTYRERIALDPFVHVYGGFAGTETYRDERDWMTFVTILCGHGDGSVVSVLSGGATNVVDGFTIRDGLTSSHGGGIYCGYSSPTIANNAITGNGADSHGGGVYCEHSSPTITKNTIGGNSASSGSGIYCNYSSPTITNNTIAGNSAAGSESDTGGGGIYCYYSAPTIANNTITGNTVTGRGGSCCGGGIMCGYATSPTITNNTIAGNSVTGGGSSGGGGIYCSSYSSSTITNNTIMGNSAYNGGGIYCVYSTPTIANDTITGNRAFSGGGIYCDSGSPVIVNTVVAFNSSGIFWADSGVQSLRYNCVYGNASYNYSGLTDPTGTDGNISADPGFVRTPSSGPDGQWATADDEPGDVHLKTGSPCIDAGDNAAVPAGVLTDLDGLSRFVDDPATPDTGLGTTPIVDKGVYEYVPGDFDRDGNIDSDDLKVFAACVSGPAVHYAGDCAKADFDGDGDVDQSDFGFIQRWFGGAGK